MTCAQRALPPARGVAGGLAATSARGVATTALPCVRRSGVQRLRAPRRAAACRLASRRVFAAATTAPSEVVAPPPSGVLPWTEAQLAAKRRGLGPPLGAYDAKTLAADFAAQPLVVAARVAAISAALGSFGALLALDLATGSFPRTQAARAAQLRRALTRLGPTFIKLGQALSTRPDLMPPPFLAELAELQDALPGFPDAQAFALIEAELGMPLERVYRRLSPKPVAAASLGQVYRGELLDGEAVAIKVQRPGTAAAMRLDFFIVRAGAALLDGAIPGLNTSLAAAVDAFAAKVFGELDYVAEGRSAERFAALYGDAPDVLVPAVHWGACSSRVMTMEWVDGIKLSDTAALTARGLDVVRLVNIGIRCSLRQLLEAGFFHADPHPGNLLGTSDGRLAFIDFGMMAETPATARYAIIVHVCHLVNRDYDAMARDYYALGFLERTVDVRPIVPALAGFFDDVLVASVSELNFKTIVDGLGAILYAYPFNVPAYYALIMRSLTVLEGLALSTDPNFKVLAAAYPFFASRLLADDAPALREALTELLFSGGRVRWARLESLLREARKAKAPPAGRLPAEAQAARAGDADAMRADALPALVDLLLGPEAGTAAAGLSAADAASAAQLRALVEAEAARVAEALLLGGGMEGLAALAPLRAALPPALAALAPTGAALLPEREAEEARELRASVTRIAELLAEPAPGGAEAVDWGAVAQLMRQPRCVAFLNAVAQRVAQRAFARTLRGVLAPQQQTPVPAVAR